MQNSLKSQHTGVIIEDSIDTLIKKLEGQGKKVKIINEDEENTNETNGDEEDDEEMPAGKKKKK